MVKPTVSAAHSLTLIPTDAIIYFAVYGLGVKIALKGQEEDSFAIPGSVEVSASVEDDDVFKKTLTYKRRNVDLETAACMEGYSNTKLVAIYVDETGSRRVMGSPDYPLTFSYTTGGGVFSCKLEGRAPTIDLFLT